MDSFLESLNHPMQPAIESLRLAALDADDAITEQIKWNAPSFCFQSVDRVTFNLRPRDRGQVIFPSAEAAAARQTEFVALVREWVRA